MKHSVSKATPTISRVIKDYLKSAGFKRQVVRAYERYEVLTEADLRGLVARLLRSKLRAIRSAPANRYTVATEVFLRDDRVKPDVLVWRGGKPRFWIELKDTRAFMPLSANTDWKKLQRCCRKYKSVNAGFLIYVARKGRAEDCSIVRTRRTLRLWAISIRLKDYISNFERFDREYIRRARYTRKG